MEITNFKISPNRQNLIIEIEDASLITSLSLWTDKTYKDYSLAINLVPFLNGTETEIITLSLSDLDIIYFDGIYFVEAETNDKISYSITSDLTRFKECILEKVLQTGICDDCLKKNMISTINAQGLLRSLEDAIDNGFINEMLNIVKMLNKYCSKDCKTCGNYSNITNNSYYSYNSVQND